MLRNVWNVTDPRELHIRVKYCGASHKGPNSTRIGLIHRTGELKPIIITSISNLRCGIRIITDPLIAI